jgi:2-hydroxy-3-keto-5-methylthiopentenyl-1-phosphate phosphatase
MSIAIVCDFDGTVTISDVWDSIWDHFTGTDWRRFNEDYAKGLVTYPVVVERCAEIANFSRSEALEFVDRNMQFRDGFTEFMNRCRQYQIPFMLASGGLDFYVEHMMKPWLSHIQMECNKAVFPETGGLQIELPFYDPQYCPDCGNCKRRWVENFQRQGYRVVAIGDGATDYCLAESADVVFARSVLKEYCLKKGVEFTPFESFHDVNIFDRMEL